MWRRRWSEQRANILRDLERGGREKTGEKRADEAVVSSDVEYAQQPAAVWVPDRDRRTGEILPAVAVVLGRHQLHGVPAGDRGADRVGAGRALAPIPTRDEVDPRQLAADRAIAGDFEQMAVRIAKHRDIA